MTHFRSALCAAALALATAPAQASVCDYRLSSLLDGAARIAKDGKEALQDAGVLTLNNAVTGATMLGSSVSGGSAGAAAAGTGPVALALGVALLGTEAVCYFLDDRITEYVEVLMVMSLLAEEADPAYFELVSPETPLQGEDYILIKDPVKGAVTQYMVRDLYIVNGVLKNRDAFRNTVIGTIGYVAAG